MRKIILFALLSLSTVTAVNAQCTNCNMQQQTAPVVFNKHIFTPPVIGGETSGEIAYIDEPPTINGGFGGVSMTAYVYIIANGQPVKVDVSGQIDAQNVPADWNGTFYGPTNRPRVYPMAIPIKVWALPYLDVNGQPKRDVAGNILSYQIVKFFAKDYNNTSTPKVINF